MRRLAPLWGLIAGVALVEPCHAGDLLRRVPIDAYAVIWGDPRALPAGPGAATQQGGRLGLEPLLALASQLQMIPPEARVVADVIASLPLLAKYPYAFALLDVTSMPIEGGAYRLEQLQAAMVFETGGDDAAIVSRVRQLLTAHTNSVISRLDRVQIGEHWRYKLIDSRLPAWAVIEWPRWAMSF